MKFIAAIPFLAAVVLANPIPAPEAEAEPGKTIVVSEPFFTKTFTLPDFPTAFPSFPAPSFPSFPTPSFPAKPSKHVEEREAHWPKPTHHSWEYEHPKPSHHSWEHEHPTPSFPSVPKPSFA